MTSCGAVHPDKPGHVCDRPSGHTQPHRATTGALLTLWPQRPSQPLTGADSGSQPHAVGYPDWPEDSPTVADLITSHARLRDQVHHLTQHAENIAERERLLSQRVGRLRGELWTLRHLASRRHVMPARAVVNRIDRILTHDNEQAAS